MRNDGPAQAEGPGLDDQGRPAKWWTRLLFQPRQQLEGEYRLGLVVLGIAVFFALYIWGALLPQMVANLMLGIVNFMSWAGGLFTSSGTQETVAPVLTPGPTVLPSPSPSPSPFASPFASPSPSPLPR